MVGRPKHKVEINLNDISASLREIESLFISEKMSEKVREFSTSLYQMTKNEETTCTQTDKDPCMLIESMCDMSKHMSSQDKSFFILKMWSEFDKQDQVKTLYMLYSYLDTEQQSDLFSFLGSSLNDIMYRASTDKKIKARDLTLEDLKTANKEEFYNSCDMRLKAFIDSLTTKTVYNNEDINFKSNVYENILKSRNHKYVSKVGLKEHMVAYLSSGKSMHTTQVFSKQGGVHNHSYKLF